MYDLDKTFNRESEIIVDCDLGTVNLDLSAVKILSVSTVLITGLDEKASFAKYCFRVGERVGERVGDRVGDRVGERVGDLVGERLGERFRG